MDPVSVSIATSFDYAVPLDIQVPLIAEAGFTHFSLGADESHSNHLSMDGQRHLRALAARHGLAIDTFMGRGQRDRTVRRRCHGRFGPRESSECPSWSFTLARSTFQKLS